MAAVSMLFGGRARVRSCVLRTYLFKPYSVIFKTRWHYNSSLCKWKPHGGRKWNPHRNLSRTDVGKPGFTNIPAKKQADHEDKDRRIMVVLKKKKGELVPQLNEVDLLEYFSAYGEIEDVTWVQSKKKDVDSGKGYGFVSFSSTASLRQAVAAKQHTLNGKQVLVFPASARTRTDQSDSTGTSSVQTSSERTQSAQFGSPRSVSAQALSAWMSAETTSAKEAAVQTTSPQASSTQAASTQIVSAQALRPQTTSAQAASTQVKSAPTASRQTGSAQTASSWTKSAADEKRKILVSRRIGCGGEMTLKSVRDYFSAFGKIERLHETTDLIDITFESADSAERVMHVPHHRINDVMVLVFLAHSNKNQKLLRLEKAMDEVKAKQDPRNMKIAEKEGRKVVFMTPSRFKQSISKESVEEYFSSYGDIEETFIMESKGYGYVTFKEAYVAEQVLKDGDHKVGDTDVYVRMSLGSRKNHQSSLEEEKKFWVSNIIGETSGEEIQDYFSKFGKVAEVQFINKHRSGDTKDSCLVSFESIDGGIGSLKDTFHHISTQDQAVVVKVVDDKFSGRSHLPKLHVSDIPEDVTLEMLRTYFEGFGSIEYLGFTNYHSEKVLSTLTGVSVAFREEGALEKALNITIHEVNGCKLKVQKANRSFAGQPSDFLSLRVLMTNLPENLDELAVKDYLLGQSCRVRSARFLSPTVCIASLWNLRDVNRLVDIACSKGHAISGNPFSLRRFHWVKAQDEGVKLDDS